MTENVFKKEGGRNMKHSILWKRVMSCILLLSIIVGILPVQSLAAEERASDPAEGTELSALYDTVATPANQLTDLSVMMGGKGMTELDEGTYYIVNHSSSQTEGVMMDMSIRYDECEYIHAVPVTTKDGSVVNGDPDKAIRLVQGYDANGALNHWRTQMIPVLGATGGGVALDNIQEYGGFFYGAPGNPGVDRKETDFLIHYYIVPHGETDYCWYSLTYVPELTGFRPVLNREKVGTAYNRLKLYRLAFHVSELYKAIMRMKVYADGNPDGRYDAAVYEDFDKELRDCIATYNAENRLYDTDALQWEKKPELDGKAESLLSYLGKLTAVDSAVDYIDIPAEFLDFRADGLFFEYAGDSLKYNLQGHGKRVIVPLGVGGSVFTEMTEPVLLDRKLIYNEGTVSYVANLISQGKRALISNYHADGWNRNF
jgi:hypothetical protein